MPLNPYYTNQPLVTKHDNIKYQTTNQQSDITSQGVHSEDNAMHMENIVELDGQ